MGDEEIAPWLKSLPLAPEYHPTEAEFADPIGYILKIEKEASQYGICKIVPPFPKASRKLVISNINRSLIESQESALAGLHGPSSSFTVSRNMNTVLSTCPAAQVGCGDKVESFEGAGDGGDCKARFTTRHQQIGWSPRKLRGPMQQSVVQKQVWESGESYTLEQFEAKARLFYRSRLGTCKEISPLPIETMFWKAVSDRPISVEYANDIPGTAFGEPNESFTCKSFCQGRKRKIEPQSRAIFDNPDKNGIHYSMQRDLQEGNNKNYLKASALNILNVDAAEGTHIESTTKLAEDTDIAESTMAGKRAPDEMSDYLEDGVKTTKKGLDGNVCKELGGAGWKLSNSAWNMRIVARSPGSLIRHMPDEVPGVTTPMVYIGMLFSWFAWHVEDHELHSLNYLHMGSPKTWYAVPGDAAASLEDVIRVHGYGEHFSPLAAFAMLGEKTTLMSPEILIKTGVPCCRLVQNPGEFVVTFPRAYHLGFSHGFNCGEAANIATPAWLKVAKEAALRRAAMSYLPMLSHQQLLYMLSLSFRSWIPVSLAAEPRSSRLKDRKRSDGEMEVKDFFVNDMIHNNYLLNLLLEKESTYYAVLWDSADVPSGSQSLPSCVSTISHPNWRSTFGASGQEVLHSDSAIDRGTVVCKKEGFQAQGILEMDKKLSDSMRVGISSDKWQQENLPKCSDDRFMDIHGEENSAGCQSLDSDSPSGDSIHLDTGTLACVACGILGFPCMAIIQPSEVAARNLMSAGFKVIDKHLGACEVGNTEKYVVSAEAAATPTQSAAENCPVDFLLETPIALVSNYFNYQDQVGEGLCGQPSEVNTVGDCTASLVHTAILAPSTKDGKIYFGKRKIQYTETELALIPSTKVTKMDGVLAEYEKPKSNCNNISSSAKLINTSVVSVGNGKSPDDSKAILQVTAESFAALASSKNTTVSNGDSGFQGQSSSFSSSKTSLGNSIGSYVSLSSEPVVRDEVFGTELPQEYMNKFSVTDNQYKDLDTSKIIINKPILNTFSVSSSIPVSSALDLLAATYNDASDSDEEDDDLKLSESHPLSRQSEVVSDVAGIANTQLISSGSASKAIREGTHDGCMLSGLLHADRISSVPKDQNNSFSDILKQDTGFIHSSTRRSSISQFVTDAYRNLHVNGSELSSIQSNHLQERSIFIPSPCKNSIKESPVHEAQPSDQSAIRKLEVDGACEVEGLPNLTFSSVREAENFTVSTVGTTVSISDADTVPECIAKPPKGFDSVFEEASVNVCTSYFQEASYSDRCAHGNIGGCATGYAFYENMPNMAALDGRTASLWKPCNGFMRPHVFCLEHALEVEEQLHSMGGAHLLLLCHANYCKIEEKAKLLAKEIAVDNSWKNIPLRNASEADLEMISVAIEEETEAELGRDWTAQLGVNLRYSAKLSKSPLYTKQMPYSRVLDTLFCSNSFDGPNCSDLKWQSGNSRSCYLPPGAEGFKRKRSKHKKITVAGKWCGKIWMVRQVHPYLRRLDVQHDTAFASDRIGCGEVVRFCERPRKQNIQISDSKNISEESTKETCDEQTFFPSTSDIQNPCVNRNLSRKRKLNREEQIYDSKTDIQLFEDRMLDSSEHVNSSYLSFKQVKSGDHSSEKVENADISSELSDSYKQCEQSLSLTASGAKSSIPGSCQSTSAGKSRHNRKKQTGWNLGAEVFSSPAENIQGKNNMLGSEGHAVPTTESFLSSNPDACKEQTNLDFSSTSGTLTSGPRTRLRTKSMQSNVPVLATRVDKVSGKQSRPSSKKVSTGKKVTKSDFYKDEEDEGVYHCDIEGCAMSFQTKQELLMHKRNACTVKGCGKRFGSHKYLLQHRRVHLDDRPLKCPLKACKMTFKWAWARTEHIRVHTGERPYVCKIPDCGKTFRFVSDFSRHKRKTGHK